MRRFRIERVINLSGRSQRRRGLGFVMIRFRMMMYGQREFAVQSVRLLLMRNRRRRIWIPDGVTCPCELLGL